MAGSCWLSYGNTGHGLPLPAKPESRFSNYCRCGFRLCSVGEPFMFPDTLHCIGAHPQSDDSWVQMTISQDARRSKARWGFQVTQVTDGAGVEWEMSTRLVSLVESVMITQNANAFKKKRDIIRTTGTRSMTADEALRCVPYATYPLTPMRSSHCIARTYICKAPRHIQYARGPYI